MSTQANQATSQTESDVEDYRKILRERLERKLTAEPEMSADLRERLERKTAEDAQKAQKRLETLLPVYQRQIARLNAESGSEDVLDGYTCNTCKNRGYLYKLDGVNIVRTNCKCMKARKSIRRMKASGLESVIKRYRLDTYEAVEDWQKEIKQAAEAFVKDHKEHWFYVGGMSGSGKSHIATAICRQLLKDAEVYYMMWEEQSVELKASVNDPDYYQDKLNKLKEVDVLYIDDFMSGRKDVGGKIALPTFADVRLAREILNHRYINRKTTIISSEWFVDEIIDEIDVALGGRIVEMSKGYCFNIARDKSRNYRMKA